MNAGDDTGWDVGFGEGREQSGTATFGTAVANQARLTLSIYDYGGSSKAKAKAGANDEHVSDLIGVPASIPNTGDSEQTPDNSNHGDGISALEEWRGFIIQGNHKRLNPFSKDLFVFHENANLADLDLLWAQNLGVSIWTLLLTEVELPSSYVNFRAGNVPDHHGQRALRIVESGGGGNCTQLTCFFEEWVPTPGAGVARPNTTQEIRIFSNNIRFASPDVPPILSSVSV